MKRLVLFAALLWAIPSLSQMTMNGTAVQYGTGCNCYQLTPNTFNTAGAIWSPTPIDLTNNFDMTFQIYTGNAGVWNADGMAFVLQENSNGLGNLGNGLGYGTPYSIPLSANNLAIEVDIFDNGGAVPTDISQDHVGMSSNGQVSHNLVAATQFPGAQEISDGAYHEFRVQWDAGLQVLAVYWEGAGFPLIAYNADIINTIFAGNSSVYWGWTGSEGGISTETRVCVTSTANFTQDLTSVCPGLPVVFTDASSSPLGNPIAWAWDFGDGSPIDNNQNPTHSWTNPGVYTITLTMTDPFGCDYTANSSVTVLDSLMLNMSATDVSCFGSADGTATGLSSNGTGPYSYQWNDSGTQTTSTATGLDPGTFTVTVTDNLGCVGIDSVTVSEPLEIMLTMDSSMVNCTGDSSAWASVAVTNGVAPFNYLWDDAATQTTDTASNLPAGTYAVVVTDDNGCTATDSVTITEPASAISASATSTPDNGTNNGTIDLTVNGGTPPYTFDWDNDGTGDNDDTEDLSGLAATTYNVTITDSLGCTYVLPVTVNSSAGFESLSDIGFNIYPNPTQGQFEIQGFGEYDIIITDMTGKIVYTAKGTDNSSIELNVENGIYLVKVLIGNGEFVDKLIIH